MRPSVHITTPPPSYDSMVKRLRIPKARQKQLLAMIAETRSRLAAERETLSSDLSQLEEKRESASAAR
jgi:hypothetical protein